MDGDRARRPSFRRPSPPQRHHSRERGGEDHPQRAPGPPGDGGGVRAHGGLARLAGRLVRPRARVVPGRGGRSGGAVNLIPPISTPPPLPPPRSSTVVSLDSGGEGVIS